MPLAMIKHIKSENVLPTKDLPEAQDVKSLGVVEENIELPVGYSLQIMAEELANQLHTKVMQRGIHPGHCAVIFDGDASVKLFPPQDGGLPKFINLVNETLRRIPARSQADHMMNISTMIEETLLYSTNARSAPSNSASIPMVLDAEATAEYQLERHAEVLPIKGKV